MSARSESAMRASRGRTAAGLVAVVRASAGDAPMRTSRSPAAVDVTRRERREAGGMGGKAGKRTMARPARLNLGSESFGIGVRVVWNRGQSRLESGSESIGIGVRLPEKSLEGTLTPIGSYSDPNRV